MTRMSRAQGGALTVGVDLAFQDKDTFLCAIRWSDGRATIEELTRAVSDDDIVASAERADRIAIDMPFGWPSAYPAFVTAHMRGERVDFPGTSDQSLWERLTDQRVHEATKKPPLSPSGDKLAKTTARCAALQQMLLDAGLQVSRSGRSGNVIETYPGAIVCRLGVGPRQSYKKPSKPEAIKLALERRRAIASHFARVILLEDPEHWIEQLAEQDDYLDAFICGIVGHAHLMNETDVNPADDNEWEIADREGWIHIASEKYLRAADFEPPG